MKQVKKGFTLIEIAIVLVVIGLILGMVMKGRSLIDAAQLRSEMNKVNKIQAAYTTFYSKYNRRPGTASDNSTKAIYDDLLAEGMVSDADFKIESVGSGYWGFTGCKSGDNNTLWESTEASVGPNVCLAAVATEPASNTTDGKLASTTTGQFACYLDTILDDKLPTAGQGRTVGAATGINVNACDKSVTTAVPYLYRIY